MTQRQAAGERFQRRHGAVAVLDVGGLPVSFKQEALCVRHDVTLAPLEPLGCVSPRGPPLSVVGTLWLSITPSEGLAV